MEFLPLKVKDWSNEDVSNWLKINNLGKIVDSFNNCGIKGSSLLSIQKKNFEELKIMDILTMKEGDYLLELLENLNMKENDESFIFKIKDFEFNNEINSGSYGKVYKVTKKSDTTVIRAVKKIENSKNIAEKNRIEVEKNILKSIDHPNIIKIFGYCEDIDFVYFLMEYIPNSIKDHYEKNIFSLEEIRIVTKSLIEGLTYIHKNGYIHRDLKCANVLLNDKLETKIIDFGLSYIIDDNNDSNFKTRVGTKEFLAPELYFKVGNEYGRSCDIWSLGCLVLEMYSRGHHWKDENPYERTPHPPIPIELSNNFKDFLTCCFHIKPLFRPTAEQLLLHPWILGESELFETKSNESILLSEYEKYQAHYFISGLEMCIYKYSYDKHMAFRDMKFFRTEEDINYGNEIETELFSSILENISYFKVGHYVLPFTKEIKLDFNILKKKFSSDYNDTKEYFLKELPDISLEQILIFSSLELLGYYSYSLIYKYSLQFVKSKTFHQNMDHRSHLLRLSRNYNLLIGKTVIINS